MFIKFLPYIVCLIGLALCVGYVHHAGYVSGKASVQSQFDAFVKQQQALATQAHIDAVAKDVAARKTNAKALADYQRQLSNSHAYADFLVSKLRPYLSPSGGGVPEGQNRPGAADPGQAPSAPAIGERLGNALAECHSNDAQLDRLRDELIPQL